MIGNDVRILVNLVRGQSRRGSHAERLEAFYGPQAGEYDRFRERLLHGRADLIERLDPPAGAHVVELGGGTGRNLLFFGERLREFGQVEVVDLCPSLLEQARLKATELPNVRVIEGDATRYRPDTPADCVYFSYSLTMMPDWQGAIDNALAMLRPGGTLGVVDFYMSGNRTGQDRVRHGWLMRQFWPRWFGHDGVHLGPERLDYLCRRLPEHQLEERLAPVPYLPAPFRVPYYLFLARKPG